MVHAYITRELQLSVGRAAVDVGESSKKFGAIPGVEVGTWWETRSALLPFLCS